MGPDTPARGTHSAQARTLPFTLKSSSDGSNVGNNGNPTTTNVPMESLDYSTTFSALSSAVKVLKGAGSRHTEFVTRTELDLILATFTEHGVDLSDITGFPYGDPELEDCLILLARLQNRLSMQGVQKDGSTVKDIIENALLDRTNKTHRYNIGEWIEVRGPSMRYRLEQIEDVVRITDDEGEGGHFVYETAVDHKLDESQIRWPREALRRIFGLGPWAWQQWACLKLEKKLRFQEGHQDDLELLDIRDYALELWEVWLTDPRNTEFRNLFERVGISGQNELLHHITSPFNLMHEIVNNTNDEWTLEDAETSIFTYVSLLGAGFLDATIVFLLELAMPIILFFYYTSPAREENEIAVGTREMLFAVLLYYLYRVNQDLWSNFNRIAGISDSTASRIRNLRRITWDNGNDSLWQSLGYTVDLFMNTGYVTYLYLFNIWILFNVSDPFELLGSVIIFEFLFDLDEEIANTSWWDNRKRFLKAGIISIIMQNTIRSDCITNSKAYMEKMGATLSESEHAEVKRRFDEAGIPHDFDFLHGTESEEGGTLLTVPERVERLRGLESKASLSGGFVDLSEPHRALMNMWSWDRCMFQRHKDLRAWSQWEVILFAFPTPKLVPPDFVPGSKLKVPDAMADREAKRRRALFFPGNGRKERFYRHVVDVLKCSYFARNFKSGSDTEAWWFRFTRSLHAFLAWNSYFIQLCFPILTTMAVLGVFTDVYCYLHLGKCEFLSYSGEDPF